MAEQFYTLVTDIGLAKITNGFINDSKVDFMQMAVGDGGGSYYSPTTSQTSLVREVWRGPIGIVGFDEKDDNRIQIVAPIPAATGGFFIREVGLYDIDGDLIVIAKHPETYKPVADSGSTKDVSIKLLIEVVNAGSIVMKIDPTIITATRKYVDDKVADVVGNVGTNLIELGQQLTEHLANEDQHVTSTKQTLWNNALQPNVYSGNKTMDNFGSSRAVRAMPEITWVKATPELYEYLIPLTDSIWGLLEIDIAAFSMSSGGAKILVELGISASSSTSSSTEFCKKMKVLSASKGFTDNFYVEIEHRPTAKVVLVKLYKRTFNDALSVVFTLTSTLSSTTAFDILSNIRGSRFDVQSVDSTLQKDLDARTPLAGVGNPEGIITATPGRLFSDTVSGKLFVKETGTGNTGWIQK